MVVAAVGGLWDKAPRCLGAQVVLTQESAHAAAADPVALLTQGLEQARTAIGLRALGVHPAQCALNSTSARWRRPGKRIRHAGEPLRDTAKAAHKSRNKYWAARVFMRAKRSARVRQGCPTFF